jgi:S-DNA-T family DNA segregation ATPase FtsK/SpoIIIE
VGIEVPNKEKQQLGLRDMLDTPEFKNSGNLTVAIGKNITNNPVYGDIENMPHLLIAGATKSGKSVTVQNLIISLLYKNSPDDLKLVVIDPKKVEFTLYKNLPHLGTPVITDPKNAIKCLNWAIDEMERRYDYFAEEYAGIQNLADYNKKVLSPALVKARRTGKVPDDMPERLPYIVVIFDEFNDFMLTYPKEITMAITSLTQKGRAAGIHLILATQRPDVKVITGTIKANIPARIALKTSSAIDSRTILDQTGAEDLLGKGDMLFMDPGEPRPFRVQAPFVSSEEVRAVVDYIKTSYYDYEGEKIDFSKAKDNISQGGSGSNSAAGEPDDDDYLNAKEYVISTQRASASGLQSRFGWGFPKANGMIMKLEDNYVVSQMEGNKRRVLMTLGGNSDADKINDAVEDLF